MQQVYLDNAATTPMDPAVIEIMQQAMLNNFGNPSSTHQIGRKAKVAIETVRKNIAKHFNVSASEIFFTSSGTEADNFVLNNAVENLYVKRIITSKIEHYAVLKVLESLQEKYKTEIIYVNLDEFGQVDLNHLESLLAEGNTKTLVSLMMINNEIGNMLPMQEVAVLCKKFDALFHSDTVQAIGFYTIDLKEIPIDFIVASAHKFHGPKGVGFVYSKKGHVLKPMLYGGGQEKGLRSSTENVAAIVAMDKALALAYENMIKNKNHILSLKKHFLDEVLKLSHQKIEFNGLSKDFDKSSYKILSVRFPFEDKMMLFNLDLAGVIVSGGSACQSGANKGSHVLKELLFDEDAKKSSVRFSFSKFNSIEELNIVLKKLKCFFAV